MIRELGDMSMIYTAGIKDNYKLQITNSVFLFKNFRYVYMNTVIDNSVSPRKNVDFIQFF